MRVEFDYDVKNLTSFKCGGKIKKVIFPESIEEFSELLAKEKDAKVFGNLSNTLVSTDGYDGTVILTTRLVNYEINGTIVKAECGLKGPKLAQAAAAENLSGLEFMIAFPGSIGGEVFMNAGAHGQSVSDTLIYAVCYDREKQAVIKLSKEEMDRLSIQTDDPFIDLWKNFFTTIGIKERENYQCDFNKCKDAGKSCI